MLPDRVPSWSNGYGANAYSAVESGDPYQQSENDEPQDMQEFPDKKQTPRAWAITAVSCVLLALTGVLAFSGVQNSTASPPRKNVIPESALSLTGCKIEHVALIASNEYGEYDGDYPWLDGPTHLVEPYKQSTLTLKGFSSCEGYTYIWEGVDSTGAAVFVLENDRPFAELHLEETGIYQLTVKVKDTTGTSAVVYTGTVISKYVKRELRDLTLEDRTKFMDTAITLWKIDTDTGRGLYGPKYTSIATFVEEHALASNDIRCDSYHEGSGFITHHLALQNSFEASLRSINPSITTPYWDFTIEGQIIQDAGEIPSYFTQISPIFTDAWFGSVDSSDHIEDSRWAHVSMPKVHDGSVVNPNSYGYVRSYWNNNNDPEVTRHMFDVCGVEPKYKTVPACSDHYGVMSSTTLGQFQMTSPGYGHGPMHVLTGGMGGGCVQGYANFVEKWGHVLQSNISDQEIVDQGFEIKKVRQYGFTAPRREMLDRVVMGELFHAYRSLWRSHMCSRDSTPQLLQCPKECAQDTPVEECACTVPGLVEGTTDWEDVLSCVINANRLVFFQAFWPRDMLRDLVIFVATTPLVEGEMLEAASPADIMFWMIHPAVERLLAAKRVTTKTVMGNQKVTEWRGQEEEWMAFSYYSQAAGENPTYPEAYTCYGHGPDDAVLPDGLPLLEGYADLADTNRDGMVTNWEYYLAIDPNNVEGADYVFNHFKWDHCSEDSTRPIKHDEEDTF